MVLFVDEMNQGSFEKLDKRVFLLPVGSVEPHGEHLPLGTDTIIAEALAKAVSDRKGWPVLPAIQYGFIYGLRDHPGSISIPEELLQDVIISLARQLKSYGASCIAIINCHIPNSPPINQALFKLLVREQIRGINLTFPGYEEAYSKFCESKLWMPGIFHAEELETSLMLFVNKSLVKMEKAVRNYPLPPKTFGFYPHSWKSFSNLSIVGDPTLATEEKGAKLFEFFVTKIIDLISDFQNYLS
ncbi:MAG: creatininase family protein [Conexivisphaerales archaeon]